MEIRILPRSCARSNARRGLESDTSSALTIVFVSKTKRRLLVIKYGIQYFRRHSSALGFSGYLVHHFFQRASIG